MIRLKTDKGITIVTLVITIVVLLILTGTVIYNIKVSNGAGKYNSMIADIRLLQDKVLIYYNKYGEIPKTSRSIYINNRYYYEIDLSKLGNITLNFGNDYGMRDNLTMSSDLYVITDTVDVYYLKGTQMSGELYHQDNQSSNEIVSKLPQGIKVGDYINYEPDEGTYKVAGGENGSGYDAVQTFTTETGDKKLKWRILSIDEISGKIELVSDSVGETLTLRTENGYNHGVDILNDLCNTIYSKTINGKKVAIGRSINVEDIDKKTTFQKEKYVPTNESENEYGHIIKLSEFNASNRKYPSIYSHDDGFYIEGKKINGIGESDRYDVGTKNQQGITEYTKVKGYIDENVENKNVYLTYTYYTYDIGDYLRDDLEINNAPLNLINIGSDYYLASRCIYATNKFYAGFHIRRVNNSGILNQCQILSYSNGTASEYASTCAVRPVVTIDNYKSLEKDTVNSNSTNTYWNINF